MSKILLLLALLAAQISPLSGGSFDVQKKVDDLGPVKKTESLGMQITSKSAIVVDRKTKKVLYEKNPNQRMAMASMTKLMTAIVFLEESKKNLNDRFLVPYEITVLDGAGIGLESGEEITYKDLLWGALIGSGNDAAEGLALTLDNRKEFIDKMNEKAKELGLLDTHFACASGLDTENHYSTASDMAKILDYALGLKEIKEAIKVKEFDVNSLNTDLVHHILNTNRLLRYDYPKMVGGKTGYTDAAGFCLASLSSDEKNNDILTVVMNSDLDGNQFQDTKALVDWTYKNYKWAKL
ncbi:MAG: D-alanyl-D-alanine carboxypeptidase family protein [Patescibacteria group bacterium]|jgi:D-alanyl-D-alanine carboxypeptidase (penicillin-binding protein 5/6)